MTVCVNSRVNVSSLLCASSSQKLCILFFVCLLLAPCWYYIIIEKIFFLFYRVLVVLGSLKETSSEEWLNKNCEKGNIFPPTKCIFIAFFFRTHIYFLFSVRDDDDGT